MAKRRAAAGSTFGSGEALSSRILDFIKESSAALEAGTITEKEFGNRITNAMRQAGALPDFERRKLRLDAQSARLSAKDSATLRRNQAPEVTPRTPRPPLTEERAQQRLRVLSGPDSEIVKGARISRKAPQPFVQKAFGGVQLPNVAEPRLAAALQSGDRTSARSLLKGQQGFGKLKRAGAIGGVSGVVGSLILSKLFAGKQNEGIDPAIQFQLAQQLGGGGQQSGVNTSRTLSQVGKLLTIIKTLQGLGGLAGPASQEPRLI